jgi:hypothetical protein
MCGLVVVETLVPTSWVSMEACLLCIYFSSTNFVFALLAYM